MRSQLTVDPTTLARAGASAGIEADAIVELWNELDTIVPGRSFDLPNIAYYLGAMIVISATTWFVTRAWDGTDGIFKLSVALVYAAVFIACGFWLRKRGARVPAGLLFTAAVCTTPFGVYGIESAAHFWAATPPGAYPGFYVWVRGSWILMELATIAVGLVAVRLARFPFIVAPIGFATWFASMDLAAFCHRSGTFTWSDRANVSLAVGMATLVVAWFVDRLTRDDYAFWLYFFGSLSFWSGVWMQWSDGQQWLWPVLGLASILASLTLNRRVLAVFGFFELFAYLAKLAWRFRDSMSFPIELTLCGLAVIALGFGLQTLMPKMTSRRGASRTTGRDASPH